MTLTVDMLSHETKNGLAVISLTLSAPTFGERQRERVATAIKSLGSIIDRCTQVTQLDTRSQEVASEICDPASILRTICQNSNASDRIEINSPESLAVRSDPVLLHVILTNLIENAEKYSDPTSTIRVRMFLLHETRLDFEIENEACASGLPDSALIFQKYYRSSCALSQIGSGLGLYLVHGLVRILGGSITYDPCDNRVRFRFWIPC